MTASTASTTFRPSGSLADLEGPAREIGTSPQGFCCASTICGSGAPELSVLIVSSV